MQNLGKIVLFFLILQYAVLGASDFNLTLRTADTQVYVSEPFEVVLTFKEKNSIEAVNSKFTPPVFKGFWIKKKSKPQKIKGQEYSTTVITYTIAAQRTGRLKISKAQLQIATSEQVSDISGELSPQVQWKTYDSNDLFIDVMPLPDNAALIGTFLLTVNIDKVEVNASEPVSLSVRVQGNGNLEDIDSFEPIIDEVNILSGGMIFNDDNLTQKIVFVAQRDFEIPPFTLTYFDPVTKKIRTTTTDKIHVKVKNLKPKQKLIIKENNNQLSTTGTTKHCFSIWMVASYIFGLISGILLLLLTPWHYFISKKKSVSLKDPRSVLMQLLPHVNDKTVAGIVESLEKNIYDNANIKIDKNILKDIVDTYDL